MQKRRLGKGGPEVSAVGLGCMGMSEFYSGRDDRESLVTRQKRADVFAIDGLQFLRIKDAAFVEQPYLLRGDHERKIAAEKDVRQRNHLP